MRVTEPFHLTAAGAVLLATRADLHEALALAVNVPHVDRPQRAALGVSVRVRDEHEAEHEYFLVSAVEYALLKHGASVEGPLGRALLGAEVGDVREAQLPRGVTELEVIGLS